MNKRKYYNTFTAKKTFKIPKPNKVFDVVQLKDKIMDILSILKNTDEDNNFLLFEYSKKLKTAFQEYHKRKRLFNNLFGCNEHLYCCNDEINIIASYLYQSNTHEKEYIIYAYDMKYLFTAIINNITVYDISKSLSLEYTYLNHSKICALLATTSTKLDKFRKWIKNSISLNKYPKTIIYNGKIDNVRFWLYDIKAIMNIFKKYEIVIDDILIICDELCDGKYIISNPNNTLISEYEIIYENIVGYDAENSIVQMCIQKIRLIDSKKYSISFNNDGKCVLLKHNIKT